MTRTTITIAVVAAIMASAWIAPAQDDPTTQLRTIRIAGTETIVETGVRDGQPFARVSRNGGADYEALEAPRTTLNFHYRVHDPVEGQPEIPGMLLSGSTRRLFVVQFHTQPLAEYRAGLEALGAEVHHYLANQAYLVRMNAARVAEARALPYVRYVGRYELAYKLEPAIVTMLRDGALGEARRFQVMLVDSKRDEAALVAAIRRSGGVVDRVAAGGAFLEATLDAIQLLEVASEDTVLWIDRWSAPEHDMDNARIQGGANYVEPKKPEQYTGKGIRGMIYEGIYATHTEFAANSYRSTPIVLGSSRASGHGNSTFGEVFARGARAQARGMCPDGQGLYSNYSGLPTGWTRYSIVGQLVDPNKSYRGMFQTASWGGSRTTLYTSTSADMDKIIFDHDIPITQSQSNAGSTSEPRASRPQAWAKNVISVGGTRHYDTANPADDKWAQSGSTGPAQDGRIKPELCAYYDLIYTTGSSSTRYTSIFGGTSGATPMVCGHLGLSLELYTDGLFGQPMKPGGWKVRFENRPHFTTSKALLIATAAPYTISPAIHTRYTQGWGFPDLQNMYDNRDRMLVLDELDVLQNRKSVTYFVFVPGTLPELKMTMTYADLPLAPVTAYPHRINDLSLSAKGPEGSFFGNNGLISGNVSTPGGAHDQLNTVENIFLSKPKRGIWEIVVTASEVNQDSHVETPAVDADFALVVNGITGCRDKSGLELALTSQAAADLRVKLAKLPSGWQAGRVIYSLDTTRPLGMGHFFGLEADTLSVITLSLPHLVGSPFGFSYTTQPVFPNTEYQFSAAVAGALKGLNVDALAYVFDASGVILDFSNCARVMVL